MGRYMFNKSGEKETRKNYERVCQDGCGYFIDTSNDDYVIEKNKCYHVDCYIKKLTGGRNSLSEDYARKLANDMAYKTHIENIKKAEELKEDSEFSLWLCQQYGVTMFSSRFYNILNEVYNGTYKNISMAICKEHLRDMWKQKMPYLNRIGERNRTHGKVIEKEQKAIYDLTILINKYDDYLSWLQRNKIKADVVIDDVKLTDNKVYDNLVSKVKPKNEKQDDVDEWF